MISSVFVYVSSAEPGIISCNLIGQLVTNNAFVFVGTSVNFNHVVLAYE